MRANVLIALLITASSHRVAASNQTEPVQTPGNDFVASSGTIGEMLPRRESQNFQDDSTLYEERTPLSPRSSLNELQQAFLNTANARERNAKDVIADAAKAIADHKKLMPALEAISGKRKRIDSAPYNGQALHVASDVPSVSAHRLGRDQPTVSMNNEANIIAKHDLRLAPPGSPTSSVASSSVRSNEHSIAHERIGFDMNKHPGEVEIRNSRRQRVSPKLYNAGEQDLYALPDINQAPVWVAADALTVLASRLKIETPTAIIYNAVNYITHHDYRPAPSGASTTSAAAPVGQLSNHLLAKKALELGMDEHSDEVTSQFVRHYSHLLEKDDVSALPVAVDGQSVPIVMRNNGEVTKEVERIHEAFLKTLSLPFNQYPQETAKLISIVRRQTNTNPGNGHIRTVLMGLADTQNRYDLKLLLGPDSTKLLVYKNLKVQDDLKSLKEAYAVKLFIMYELFYEFYHSHPNLSKSRSISAGRRKWILKLSPINSGSRYHPILLPHD